MAEMYVHGHTVSEDVQAALLAKMKSGPFKASALEAEAVRLGLPSLTENREPVAMRAADRIIQRERKAGNLELHRPNWVWIGA
jgi:hypothetical protein